MRKTLLLLTIAQIVSGCSILGAPKNWAVDRATNRVSLDYEAYRTWSEREVVHLDSEESDEVFTHQGEQEFQALPILIKVDSDSAGISDYWDYLEGDSSLKIIPFYALLRDVDGSVNILGVSPCKWTGQLDECSLDYELGSAGINKKKQSFTIFIGLDARLEKGRSYVLRLTTGNGDGKTTHVDYPFTVIRENDAGTFIFGTLFTAAVALLTARFP